MGTTGGNGERRTIRVEHLARVEGHGGITVELDGPTVAGVRFDVFEGIRLIEGLIGGRSWEDVSPIVSRICAICSVAHALTSVRVTEAVFGVEADAETERLRDLQWRGENIESHALHLFLLAAPDYLGYPSAPAMAADHPETVALGLRLKELGNEIQIRLGGRAIHQVNALPGGYGRPADEASLLALRDRLDAAAPDVEQALELVAGLPATRPVGEPPIYTALRLENDWRYDRGDTVVVVDSEGDPRELSVAEFLEGLDEVPVPHSHAKHSHWNGRPFMVGALARVTANAARLPQRGRELASVLGIPTRSGDPLDNSRAQALELALYVERARGLVDALLDPPGSAGAQGETRGPMTIRPKAGRAAVLTEAPRGLLLHEYAYDEGGRITSANVITPTAFNAACLEDHFRAAAVRDGVEDEDGLRHTLEMIARAYDPCISCSVHLTRRR